MATTRGVLELWPKTGDIWRCFEHIATLVGLEYDRWENADGGAFTTDGVGDYTRVKVQELAPRFERIVDRVHAKRAEAASAAAAAPSLLALAA